MPFRTVMMYRWAEDVDDGHVAEFGEALDSLATDVPAVRGLTHGIDTGVTGDGFDYVAVIDVDTEPDWRAVRDHPSYILLVEELVTDRVVERVSGQFRVADPSTMSPDEANVRELSDDELMERARRAAQAGMDSLMSEADDVI